tara:strand:- start:14756 stop:15226 length:471 start_codon:yes stop_codon:yes gene_type:complete
MARPRKKGKRYPCGKLKRTEVKRPVAPTEELTRHKRAAGGGEITDPLSYLVLTDAQKKALNKLFTLAKQAGFAVTLKTSSLNQMIGGSSPDHTPDPDRGQRKWDEYHAARDTLAPLPKAVIDRVRTAHNRIEMSDIYLTALRAGADTLARHFGFIS